MNYKLVIGILIIIIIALIIGIIAVMPHQEKEDSKLAIESNSSLFENESLSVKLTDINNTPISNSTVIIVFNNQSGNITNKSVVTDSSGIGSVSLNDLNPGNYSITVIFNGNAKYVNSYLLHNLEIKQKVVEVQTETSSSSPSDSSIGPDVDSGGVTREQAEQFGYTYTTEHGGHYIGPYDHWDEKAGVYHD